MAFMFVVRSGGFGGLRTGAGSQLGVQFEVLGGAVSARSANGGVSGEATIAGRLGRPLRVLVLVVVARPGERAGVVGGWPGQPRCGCAVISWARAGGVRQTYAGR